MGLLPANFRTKPLSIAKRPTAIQYNQKPPQASVNGLPTANIAIEQPAQDGIENRNTANPTSISREPVLVVPAWRNDWNIHIKKSAVMLKITSSIIMSCATTGHLLVTDHVYYEDNSVVGTWSGTAWGQSNSWVTGFCANLLLHEEHVLEVN